MATNSATLTAAPRGFNINQTMVNRTTNPATNNRSYVNRGGFEYVINSMMLIAVVGMCVKIFFSSEFSKDGSYGPANSVIYGYGIVALSVLTIIFISYAIHDRVGTIERGKPPSILQFLKAFLTSSAPSIFVIIELGWLISLNVSYYTKINKGMVAPEYYQLLSGTSFIFVFQVVCLFQYLKLYIKGKADPKNTGANAIQDQSRIAFATYFMAAINLIVIGMMTIILQFFSTDG
jgi:hypothetical protein